MFQKNRANGLVSNRVPSQTDKKILATAITEFARLGYHEARTKEIAKSADVTEQTLFRYFKTKDVLFEAAVKSKIASIQPRAGELEFILARDPSDKGFRLAVLRFCEIVDVDFVRLYAFTVLEGRGPLWIGFRNCIDAFGLEFERLLPRPVVRGLIDYCIQARVFGHPTSKKAYRAAVDSFVEMLLKSVEKPIPKTRRTR